MYARDVMTTNVVSVTPDTPVEEIARTLLNHRISAVPVIDANGRVMGMVSEGDLMRRPESETHRHTAWWLGLLASPAEQAAEFIKSHGRTAEDVMTQPVITVEDDTRLEEVADILERLQIKRVPVLRENKVIGIVSRANLLHGLVAAKLAGTVTADEEAIRASLLEAIQKETGVQDQYLNVTVSNGTAHLWGVVRSEAERNAVRLAAEHTIGVRAIDDHVGVIPPGIYVGST
jgi:CBS domain-containing protein